MLIKDDPRAQSLTRWLIEQTGDTHLTLAPVSGDASFRRYFRFHSGGRSLIAVDAPPAQEDSRPFVEIAGAYADAGVRVPEILFLDLQQGFMCLEDFGDTLLLGRLAADNAHRHYADALGVLPAIMAVRDVGGHSLPPFDRELLNREIALFTDWLLDRHLGLALTDDEQQMLDNVFHHLVENALAQPQVGVHRDYHSRNLMLLEGDELGIIDFQDAVIGPVTYDAVSLLRDCYIQWPDDFVYTQLQNFHQRLLGCGVLDGDDFHQFRLWFDLMGMQRHIKASGIFCRLNYRDGKAGYLQDVPRTVAYIADIAARYDTFVPLAGFLEQRVLPALAAKEPGS